MMSAILALILLVSASSEDGILGIDGASGLLTYGGPLRLGFLEERVSRMKSEVSPVVDLRSNCLLPYGYLAPVIALVILK